MSWGHQGKSFFPASWRGWARGVRRGVVVEVERLVKRRKRIGRPQLGWVGRSGERGGGGGGRTSTPPPPFLSVSLKGLLLIPASSTPEKLGQQSKFSLSLPLPISLSPSIVSHVSHLTLFII